MLQVFIAEDEPVILLGFKKMVKSCGHNVIGAATSGKEAVEKVLELKPDIILMDVNLPEMDGITAIDTIHKSLNVPAVVITGYRESSILERANKAGVFGYLQKPVDEYEMKSMLQIAVSRHAEFEQARLGRDQAVANLQQRKYVERAKGILMDSFGMGEKEAMFFLQKKSKNENKKLIQIAKEIIQKEEKLRK